MASVQPSRSWAKRQVRRVLGDGQHPDPLDHLVGGGVGGRVGSRRPPAQHHHLVPGRGQLDGQRVHVPAQAADHHRRVLPGDQQHAHPPETTGGRMRARHPLGPSERCDERRLGGDVSRQTRGGAESITRSDWQTAAANADRRPAAAGHHRARDRPDRHTGVRSGHDRPWSVGCPARVPGPGGRRPARRAAGADPDGAAQRAGRHPADGARPRRGRCGGRGQRRDPRRGDRRCRVPRPARRATRPGRHRWRLQPAAVRPWPVPVRRVAGRRAALAGAAPAGPERQRRGHRGDRGRPRSGRAAPATLGRPGCTRRVLDGARRGRRLPDPGQPGPHAPWWPACWPSR